VQYVKPPTTIYDAAAKSDARQTEAVRNVDWRKPELPSKSDEDAQEPVSDGKDDAVTCSLKDPIHASLASIPSRGHILQRTVESLLPQVDIVRVFLNRYDAVPDFLLRERVVVARSQDHGDRGAAGKFFWCEEASGYELHCDDDSIYSNAYVATLIRGVERYKRKAAVGLHGTVLRRPIDFSIHGRTRLAFYEDQPLDKPCEVIGTGALAYHSTTLSLCRSEFRNKNMTDVYFAIACEKQGVPRIVLAHKKDCMAYETPPWGLSDLKDKGRQARRAAAQTEILKTVVWRTPALSFAGEPPGLASGCPTELVDVELDGVKAQFQCDCGHIITKHMKRNHLFYEWDLLRAVRALNLEGIYVDVGAHIGTHSVWFALACRSTGVVAFEPDERYTPLLRANTASYPKVEVHQQALGGRKEKVRICGYSGRTGDFLGIAEATTLDDLLPEREKVAFIKVDVDGLDIPILRGARGTIDRFRPYIAVECQTATGMVELEALVRDIRYKIIGKYCATPTYLLSPL
jgi:FkbM family methyltransferase